MPTGTPKGAREERKQVGEKNKLTDETKKTVSLDEDEYKGLLAKNIAQATEISQVKAQLKDSTDALVLIKTKIDSAEKEEKEAVITDLVRDSQGKLTVETLKDHSLNELYFLKDTLSKAEPKTFVSVMKQREADQNKPKPQETSVGIYDSATHKFVGGPEQ
jgi:septal ring factor EnvC (AmiA/AmiB activator)